MAQLPYAQALVIALWPLLRRPLGRWSARWNNRALQRGST
jgi:hypothetical protein